MIERLGAVKWNMLEEWSQMKRAPNYARRLHKWKLAWD